MSFDPSLCRNESEVESKLIVQYLLPKLGYSPDTWHQEVAFGNIRLDFLAFANRVMPSPSTQLPFVVLEAKHPQENLERHERKLRIYLTRLRAPYGLLTNGREIRIYQRDQDAIQLVFQCLGQQIEQNLEGINALIGKNNLNQTVSDAGQFSTYLSAAASQLNLNRQPTMKTIAIYHHKGGVGKTTVAINLAAALRKKGKRVLLIDIDAQANTTFAVGLVKFQFEEEDDIRERNVYHLLEGTNFNFIPELSRQSHYFNQPEIDVVPSHITLIERQNELVQYGASRFRLVKKLEKVKDQYDIVIIDTPPSLDLYAEVALTAADYLIIPSDLKPFSNQGLESVKNFITKQINENKEGLGKPPIKIMGVLPSKISTHAKYLQHTFPKHRSIIPERYQLPLMENMISERMHLSHCVNQTLSVGDLEVPDPKSIFEYAKAVSTADVSAAEFEALALEVLDKMEMQ
ncbi:MAG: AAA family ATPase [Cyanophyceae cyanobacterium]